MSAPIVALLTDFGTRDWYAATLKAVILSRCPRAHIVDITHDIPPQDTLAGAFTLAAAAPWFPPGAVLLGIVDPGVGTDRALLAIRADGRYFVGPDNGLLALNLVAAKRIRIIRLTQPRYWLKTISRTFEGRDIMAPVAAYLAGGGVLSRLGVPMGRVTPLALPTVRRVGATLRGHVVHLDAFGNLITNLSGELVGAGSASRGMVLRYKGRRARVVSSYAAGRPEELIAVVGSLGLIELAVRGASAAWQCTAARGDEVELVTAPGGRR